jgi:glycine/D-amino acid oxidase-like deaminating enzyme
MVVVIGAGVVGLASARAIAMRGRQVCVLERHRKAGQDTSTHNSGVIHAGLYHPAGSLKARLCVEGRERLYAFCREHRVPHIRCGKLVVAGPGETSALEQVFETARANGASVELVDAAFVKAREPHVAAAAALWSKDTGWVEAEALVRALEADVIARDGVVLAGTPLSGAEADGDGLVIVTPRERIRAAAVVNAAGLYADEVSQTLGGEGFRIYPCRGEYAELARQWPCLSGAPCVGTRSRRAPHQDHRRRGVDRADDSVSGGQGRLRARSIARRSLSRGDASAVAGGHAHRFAPRRQRHSRQAASARTTFCGLSDSPRHAQSGRRACDRDRFARPDGVSCHRRDGGGSGGVLCVFA